MRSDSRWGYSCVHSPLSSILLREQFLYSFLDSLPGSYRTFATHPPQPLGLVTQHQALAFQRPTIHTVTLPSPLVATAHKLNSAILGPLTLCAHLCCLLCELRHTEPT